MFQAERDLLAKVIGPWLVGRIEHVGSTAVPGLPAKPVIDIMAPVEDLESSRAARVALEAIGYCYAPYKTEVEHWFCKPGPEYRTHHLHLVPRDGKLWIECIAFRDLLISDASVAKEYAALKHRLAAEVEDIDSYVAGKTDLLVRVLSEAGFTPSEIDAVRSMNLPPGPASGTARI